MGTNSKSSWWSWNFNIKDLKHLSSLGIIWTRQNFDGELFNLNQGRKLQRWGYLSQPPSSYYSLLGYKISWRLPPLHRFTSSCRCHPNLHPPNLPLNTWLRSPITNCICGPNTHFRVLTVFELQKSSLARSAASIYKIENAGIWNLPSTAFLSQVVDTSRRDPRSLYTIDNGSYFDIHKYIVILIPIWQGKQFNYFVLRLATQCWYL